MTKRSFVAAGALLLGALVALGCHDDPTSPADTSPAPDANLAAATALTFWQVSGGDGHTCAITTDNAAWCWGYNASGELGTGSGTASDGCTGFAGPFPCSTRPVPVAAGGRTFRQIAAGEYHTCAVTTDFHAWCWGSNAYGELGSATATTQSAVPVAVTGGHRFRQLDAGAYHTCGVSYPDNLLFCWGRNSSGELGDGTLTHRRAPVPVLGGLTAHQVAAGRQHSCAVTVANRAYCWGYNRDGELGDSTTALRRTKPVKVVGGQAVGTNTTTPVPVAGGLSVAQLSVGSWHTCAKTTSGAGYCWGDDFFAALGNGTSGSLGSSVVPVPVAAPL